MSGDKDEVLLVLLAQRGDVEAFEKLLRSLYLPLRKYVRALVDCSAADDVLQETSLKIFQNLRWLREPKVFRIWAYRIASRVAFLHLGREKQRRKFENSPEIFDWIPCTVPALEDINTEFLKLIEQVSPASRAVLLLHYQQQLSLEETATVLDIPVGTVKSRLTYGITQVRGFLKEKSKI
jgi:RNA polymerase sigma-70 factor, ECF subfamily